MMTDERIKQTIAFLEARLHRKPGQYRPHIRSDEEWRDYPDSPYPDAISIDLSVYEYRAKPVLSVRPWSKPEDVPGPVCWVRFENSDRAEAIIISVDACGFRTLFCHSDWRESKQMEYSTTRRADDWHKCEVTEP